MKKCARDLKPKTFAAGTFPITCRLVWEEEEGEVVEELAEVEVVVLEEGGEQYVATFISCFPSNTTTEERGAPKEVILATTEKEVSLIVSTSSTIIITITITANTIVTIVTIVPTMAR